MEGPNPNQTISARCANDPEGRQVLPFTGFDIANEHNTEF